MQKKKKSKTENKCTIRSIATQDYSVIVISYIVTFSQKKEKRICYMKYGLQQSLE